MALHPNPRCGRRRVDVVGRLHNVGHSWLTFGWLSRRQRTVRSIVLSLLSTPAWASDEVLPPGSYEITAQTAMPHLEENLRYAMSRERLCLHGHELSSVFSVLPHQALSGCELGDESRLGDTVGYLLVCPSPGARETIPKPSMTGYGIQSVNWRRRIRGMRG